MAFQIRVILATLIVASVNLVYGQVSTSCTTSMMSSFTPCANIITGSTNNGLVPPSTCCDLLRSLMSTNMDCACMVISANAPFFQQPLSQALALSLSQACNINGVPLQCKASGSPLLVPDSRMVAMGKAQKYENMQLARELSPASSPVEAETPTRTRIPQIRPVLTPRPSASHSSFASPSAFPFFIGILVFGIY
uniref:Bifunctional inhibitor/plant lipid transfer protein/seed storage helical domain-containing protein n=1 Tax=Glycine max TaxID=3847 RepID=A0A0R0EX86_SOYBN